MNTQNLKAKAKTVLSNTFVFFAVFLSALLFYFILIKFIPTLPMLVFSVVLIIVTMYALNKPHFLGSLNKKVYIQPILIVSIISLFLSWNKIDIPSFSFPAPPTHSSIPSNEEDLHRREAAEITHAISECERNIKNSLQFPSSFNKDFGSTSTKIISGNGMAVVFNFEAKNGFGNVIPQKGLCLIKDGSITIDVQNR